MDKKNDQGLSPLKRALLAMEIMQKKLDALEKSRNEPIAIIGAGCRFPGGACDPESFWQNLQGKVDAVKEIPPDRWDIDAYYDPDPEAPGKMYVRHGAFLDGIDRFDPAFFGISPREAATMDPQQRLLLEVSWEALENAAIAPDGLFGGNVGVFVGICYSDYSRLLPPADMSPDAYSGTGTGLSIAVGRISYAFGFHGPNMHVDTTCSSSLVTAHLACQSLRARECDLALAGGVNLVLVPQGNIFYCKLQALAPDGRCKTFDSSANGYVRGEGCGMLVLKRLGDALRDGDNILALVRGSAVNHDGRSNGLTAPNGVAQAKVIRDALKNASVAPEDVDFVECHGTGTPLGDPIELRALAECLSPRKRPLYLGAVKTNIGHLEPAAGVAGLLKTALALRKGAIPANLHFQKPNPEIPLDEIRARFPSETTPWPGNGKSRIGCVSSFGMNGTNAHVVLEQAPERQAFARARRSFHILTLSARNEKALRETARNYEECLKKDEDLADICHTANVGRSHFRTRLALVAPDKAGMLRLLGEKNRPYAKARNREKAPVFLFTGQGSQRPGMARELLREDEAFRKAFTRCDEILRPFLGAPLDEYDFSDPLHVQCAVFSVDFALYEMWVSKGVSPGAVLGHSLGEIVAACVAGVFNLEQALRLVVERAKLMRETPSSGAMAAVFDTEANVRRALAGFPELDVAAVNGPAQIVISGESSALRRALASVKSRPLEVSRAFHSPMMDSILERFGSFLSTMDLQAPKLRMLSNLSGDFAGEEVSRPEYWVRQLRECVRFFDCLSALDAAGYRTFVECGADPVLCALARRSLPDGEDRLFVPSLRKGRDDMLQISLGLASLYERGLALKLNYNALRIELPSYPFQRERHWAAAQTSALSVARPVHPLLGARLDSPLLRELVFHAPVGPSVQPYLVDHKVYGRPVLPMTAYLEAALAAASRFCGGPSVLRNVAVHTPFPLPAGKAASLQTVIDAEEGTFRIFGAPEDGEWTEHSNGKFACDEGETESLPPWAEIEARCTEEADPERLYQAMAAGGLDYGPNFRLVREIRRGDGEATGLIQATEGVSAEIPDHFLHPALWDACHQIFAAVFSGNEGGAEDAYLPTSLESFRLFGKGGSTIFCHARTRLAENDRLMADLALYDKDQKPLARCSGLLLVKSARDKISSTRGLCRHLSWDPDETPPPEEKLSGQWVVCGEDSDKIAQAVEGAGARCARTDSFDAFRGLPLAGVVLCPKASRGDTATDAMEQTLAVLELVKEMLRHSPPERLWIVTRGVVAGETLGLSGIPGLAAVLGHEHPELRTVWIDIDSPPPADAARAILRELCREGGETPVLLGTNGRHVRRMDERKAATGTLVPSPRGSLDKLIWAPPEKKDPGPGELELSVRATGLNFRDVLNTLGMLPGEPGPLGGECAGTVTRTGPGVARLKPGDEVFGLAQGCFGDSVVAKADTLLPIPAGFSPQQAAAIPIAFLTAWQALEGLSRKERILIHAATGGVGLAAVRIAQKAGAEIFATAGSPAKREFLRSLGVRHTMDSRSSGFGAEIREATGGEGVHVVLNSLSGDFIPESLEALAPNGRFMEIGKRGIWSAEEVSRTRPDVRYHVYDLGAATLENPGLVRSTFVELVRALSEGELQPSPVKVFPRRRTVAAFRHMSRAAHVGKVVVSMGGAPPLSRNDASYLVTGGAGALGLAFARHIAAAGAGKVILLGRSERVAEPPFEYVRADVSDRRALAEVLGHIRDKFPPLRGVFHAAGALADAPIAAQDAEGFAKVFMPKACGAWNLHLLTGDDRLDYFILCSSISSVFGTPGQANYAGANAFLDSLAAHRRGRGLPALSVRWGPWAGEGMAASVPRDALRRSGLRLMRPEEALRALELVHDSDETEAIIASFERRTPRRAGDFRAKLAEASPDERKGLIESHVIALASRTLGIDGERLAGSEETLSELGMDSLMAVELRNRLEQDLGVSVELSDFLRDTTMRGLMATAAESASEGEASGGASLPDVGAVSPENVEGLIDELDGLSEEELEALLEKAREET